MLLDTSGLLCLHDGAEQFHTLAITTYQAAETRVTHAYVVAEFVALAHSRRLPRLPSLTFATDLLDSAEVEVVWIEEALHREAMTFLFSRLDKTYSLCDAVSFVLMRDRGINAALTTDHHFEQEGFIRLLK